MDQGREAITPIASVLAYRGIARAVMVGGL